MVPDWTKASQSNGNRIAKEISMIVTVHNLTTGFSYTQGMTQLGVNHLITAISEAKIPNHNVVITVK
jgi:ornithine carbamoyltransferase